MELVTVKPAAGALVEEGSGSVAGAGSIPAMVAAQQQLLHEQVDQLQRLVVAQCRLTGVNPLAQEMAAGALSIKIGKRPRDLLNPKAVKYMQSLFALKDTLGKRETRELSLLCGVTVTQVREFFTIQKSRVRKFVRLSQEKALRIETPKEQDNAYSIDSEQIPLDIEAQAEVIEPLSTLEPVVLQSSLQPTDVPQVSLQSMALQQSDLQHMEVFQNTLHKAEAQQNFAAPMMPPGTMVMQPTDAKISSDSVQKDIKQEETHPGVESEDKKFLESIFALMQKEETFSGQVKLMEWILQINNATVLSRFVTMGGLTIMSTWLSQAAIEEQTSVIHVIFKALPVHMSVVLQTINRLRFYRTQDISSRARNLLSRLSKVLVRIQALKQPQKDSICKQRISEILRDESWKSEVDITEKILALADGANESRKPEPKKTPMLLTASADETNKRSSVQTKSKQKRKVLLVEHPNKKVAGKNANSVRNTSTNNSRPLSADDIQKAKMRAMFMQEKYGKVDTNKASDKPQAMETPKRAGLVNSNASPMPISPRTSAARPVDPSPSTSKQSTDSQPDNREISGGLKLDIGSKTNVIEKLDSKRVLWQIPPAVWIDPSWSVGAGDNSKEVEVQTQRNRREKETFYASQKDIPTNPKDPWDLEMDFDDSLTPEIPIDQTPDVDAMETDSVRAAPIAVAPVKDKQIESTSSTSGAVADGAGADTDYELLTVLLKNPELVFALTSNNKGENMPNEQTIALLDTLKQTGLSLSELVNSLGNGAGFPKEPEPEAEPLPASLPSPTPPDRTSMAVWRPENPMQVMAPNLQQPCLSSRGNTPPIANAMQQSFSNVVSSLPSQLYASVSVLPAQIQANTPSLPQLAVSVNPPIRHVSPVNNHPNRALVHQHNQQYALLSDPVATPLHQQAAVSKSTHGVQSIPNPAVARSSVPEPNASYTTLPWQSSAADIIHTGRNAATDPWAARTTNSYNTASANTVPFANQNAYGDQSSHTAYNSYGSAAVSSHSVLPGHGHDRNGYSRPTVSEYQSLMVQDSHRRHSRSPDPGVVRDYGGTQGYNQQSRTHWSAGQGQQSYNPEPSRQWSSSQAHQGYTPAESSRQWSTAHQSYTPEPSRQRSSERQGYNVEPSRSWSSGQQGQNPEASRQWNRGKQDPYYNPSDGRRSYDQHRRR
ncbi:homeobox protein LUMINIDEPENDENS isoform X2 [Sorghum bicolor]|uniref:homeobox protein LUMINIDEPENDENS isoform X2 n=1 Tax=Sorghum bicolor TaxID=4558 RepID=UPI000B424C5E|nr:homeobox protein LUMINIDEPENDENS isoform X2 [Sorghum bicolor]|eukprot:XP_021312080.1 homeobox protein LUMINIDEPENDENS isoform X2 [Sorghum bicolor]